MQGKHLELLRTFVIYAGMDDEKAKDLAAKYQPLDLYKAKTDDLSNWEKQFQVASDTQDEQKSRFYVVDSKGLLMISYPSDADYKLVNKDLKRLLKARR